MQLKKKTETLKKKLGQKTEKSLVKRTNIQLESAQ